VDKTATLQQQNVKTKDEVAAFALEMCVRERGETVAKGITYCLEEASKQLKKESLLEAIALVSSFKDDAMAMNVAERMERRAPYIRMGKEETEVISELGRALAMYTSQPSALTAVLNVWSSVAYCSDWGDPTGALEFSKIMQKKEIAFIANFLQEEIAGPVTASIAEIANYLKDSECTVAAARSIAMSAQESNELALSRARLLEEKAHELGNEAIMSMGWNQVNDENKKAFLEFTLNKATEIGNLARKK
jgi:hypothetical protein